MGWLRTYRKRVRQGHQVDDANDFARYVMNSGLVEIMKENPELNITLKGLFPYDGKQLWDEAYSLYRDCCEYYQGRTRNSEGTAKGARKSDLEEIDQKLNLIAGRLAQLESVKKVRQKKPKIHVLPSVTQRNLGT
jgi:hypothetical protein